jgi:uncharacterized lipoprotein NlpE involved in copper resistance
MKKVLAIAFIAATMVACNNKSKTEETPTVDSVAIKAAADSAAAAQAAAAAADTTVKVVTDTLSK